MGQTRQAKILTEHQVERMLAEAERTRYPLRDRVMVLLSVRAGMRAREIALSKWDMVLDADGAVSDRIELHNRASKGRKGGRTIPLHPELRAALVDLLGDREIDGDARIIHSERNLGLDPASVKMWFYALYRRLGLKGASSHSGRRTFVTSLAKKIVACGGSLKDVQELAGHQSLSTTQRYIEGNSDARRKAIESL
jgi:integrase/recombinase XerD